MSLADKEQRRIVTVGIWWEDCTEAKHDGDQ